MCEVVRRLMTQGPRTRTRVRMCEVVCELMTQGSRARTRMCEVVVLFVCLLG